MSDSLSRRSVLAGLAATAAAAAMPSAAIETFPTIVGIDLASDSDVTVAWVVGSEGEFDWQHITAKNAREALRIFAAEIGHDDFEEECTHETYHEACDCCEQIAMFDARRVKAWDGKTPTSADWLRAGFGCNCSRCGYETFPEEGGRAIGDEVVCSDCMTLADWEIVDPERLQRCGRVRS